MSSSQTDTHSRELRIYRAVAYRRQKKTYSYIAIDDLWTLALVCASAQSGWNTFNPEIGWHETGSQCLLISFAHTNVATRHSTGVHERRTRSFEMRWQTDLYMPMIYVFIIRVVLTGWLACDVFWEIDEISTLLTQPSLGQYTDSLKMTFRNVPHSSKQQPEDIEINFGLEIVISLSLKLKHKQNVEQKNKNISKMPALTRFFHAKFHGCACIFMNSIFLIANWRRWKLTSREFRVFLYLYLIWSKLLLSKQTHEQFDFNWMYDT